MKVQMHHIVDRPYIDGDTIHYGLLPESYLHINTELLVVIDYEKGMTGVVEWYVFVEQEGVIEQVEWDGLTDEQRMVIRAAAKEYVSLTISNQWEHYNPGEYTDSRYYTLEALCGTS